MTPFLSLNAKITYQSSLAGNEKEARTAVESALNLLCPMGVLVICAYPGHAEGEREKQELTAFLAALDNRRYNVLHQRFLNAGPGAPECFVIQKQNGGD